MRFSLLVIYLPDNYQIVRSIFHTNARNPNCSVCKSILCSVLLDRLGCRGFTYLEKVQGRGSKTGDPHFGSHAWPSMCSAILTVVDDSKVDPLLDTLHKMDLQTEQLGLRATQDIDAPHRVSVDRYSRKPVKPE